MLTGPRDRLIVVWQSEAEIMIRSRAPGKSFGPTVRLPGYLSQAAVDSCGRLLVTYKAENAAREEALIGRWGWPSGHFASPFRLFGYGPTPYGGLPDLYQVAAGGKGPAVATRLRSVALDRSVLEAITVPRPRQRGGPSRLPLGLHAVLGEGHPPQLRGSGLAGEPAQPLLLAADPKPEVGAGTAQ